MLTRTALHRAAPALRGLAHPAVPRFGGAAPRFPAAGLLSLHRLQSSLAPTVKVSHNEEQELLVNQRKNRPLSPELKIYEPQLTWVLSGVHRITGVGMAAVFYGLTCTYAATLLLGTPFEAATLVSAFAALPVAVKVLAKAAMAYPFAFHSFNGVRHLIWDFGKELTLKGVYRTGYVVLGLTAVVGTYLTFF